jgi:hypothetical protein
MLPFKRLHVASSNMALYSSAPPERPFSDAKPTLLVAWWITLFCTCLILLRLSGRYIRVEKLFIEDKITALALLPLYLRIVCTHIVLLYGTNNIQLAGIELSSKEIEQRIIGSKVVLAGRLFHAATFVYPSEFLLHLIILITYTNCFLCVWLLQIMDA